ncbi:MAG TPA: DUF1743 domain-containing protein [Candidatus Poseidoniales archaeon]|nr:DUF1743 domain-containing protein [Candidatus Poseidoniales archaeon]
MIWVGLDDTDEREAGCTTFEFHDLLTRLESEGFTVQDERLVRLWPFAPGRTRGNAALAASIQTRDIRRVQSVLDDWFTQRYSDLLPTDVEHAAQPVLIASLTQFSEQMYWNTVQHEVSLHERREAMQGSLHRVWTTQRGRRGIIGASAAIAWRGQHDHTWECTAWREGTGLRHVPPNIVQDMAERFPSTFMNRDPNRALIAPRTPCPVLYGIRGETRQSVLDAHAFLQSSDVEQSIAHRAWRTNQATDDHLSDVRSGIVQSIQIRRGGHVQVLLPDRLMAFAEGGPVKELAQSLESGDVIQFHGLKAPDGSIHLEKLKLVHGIRDRQRPLCDCGRRFKSQGVGQKLKCPSCSTLHADVWLSSSVSRDWVEPPPSHRRHLAKPLSRSGKSED